MNPIFGFDRCLSFINLQLQPPRAGIAAYRRGEHRPVITLSRQTGSGGHAVAERLMGYLNQTQGQDQEHPWTVYDRNLVEQVLSEHHLSSHLARFMPEDRVTEMTDTMDELFGLHPPSWMLVRQTSETILHLAERGNVIVIGRGAAVITRKLNYAFQVRLVGSIERRVKRIQEANQLSAVAARDLVNREDVGRRRYLRKYFNEDIDNPLLYHLVLNTDLISYDEAARIIGEAVKPLHAVEQA